MAPPSQSRALEDRIRIIAKRPRRFRRSWMGIGFGTLIISFFVAATLSGPRLTEKGPLFLGSVVAAILLFVWMFGKQQRAELACCRLVRELVQMPEAAASLSVSAIGPLLELSIEGGVTGDFLDAPLTLLETLLRSVQADDAVILTDHQRRLLHALVRPETVDLLWAGDPHGQLRISRIRPPALRSLHYLGNRSSLVVLERFARETEDEALRREALRTLELLRARLQYGPSEMLRASIAPTNPDTLLRAVATDRTQLNDPRQLLRAEKMASEDRPV